MQNLFELFAPRKPKITFSVPVTAPIAAPDEFIIRDSVTDHVIARGTRELCNAYLRSFGGCYLQTPN